MKKDNLLLKYRKKQVCKALFPASVFFFLSSLRNSRRGIPSSLQNSFLLPSSYIYTAVSFRLLQEGFFAHFYITIFSIKEHFGITSREYYCRSENKICMHVWHSWHWVAAQCFENLLFEKGKLAYLWHHRIPSER